MAAPSSGETPSKGRQTKPITSFLLWHGFLRGDVIEKKSGFKGFWPFELSKSRQSRPAKVTD
jgi:hypothetical protein